LWQKFGTDYPFETQREIVLHAFDLGVTHFDNANRYGHALHRAAEKLFGQVLRAWRFLLPDHDPGRQLLWSQALHGPSLSLRPAGRPGHGRQPDLPAAQPGRPP
jgi:hypothetical protein